jgi:rhodanese-related sulfurtransferase
VRNPPELEICRIGDPTFIPLHELPDRLGELDPAATIAVYCHKGGRSAQAVHFLRQMGYSRAVNVAGGIDAWSAVVDPAVPRY